MILSQLPQAISINIMDRDRIYFRLVCSGRYRYIEAIKLNGDLCGRLGVFKDCGTRHCFKIRLVIEH